MGNACRMYHAGRKRIGGWKMKMKNMKLALKISSIVILILTLGLMGLWQAVVGNLLIG